MRIGQNGQSDRSQLVWNCSWKIQKWAEGHKCKQYIPLWHIFVFACSKADCNLCYYSPVKFIQEMEM